MAVSYIRSRVHTSATDRATSTRFESLDSVAPCAAYDPETFFPAHESTTIQSIPDEGAALGIRAGCPLGEMRRCLVTELKAGSGKQWGVQGGLTRGQRKALFSESTDLQRLAENVAEQLGRPVEHARFLVAVGRKAASR